MNQSPLDLINVCDSFTPFSAQPLQSCDLVDLKQEMVDQ